MTRFRRPGLSTMEAVVALAILAVALGIAAPLAGWALGERRKADAKLAALAATTNELEAASLVPWAELSPTWAAARKPAPGFAEQWPEARLSVTVEPEAKRPNVKRVTVTLRWDAEDGSPRVPPTTLVGLFASRTIGGTP